MNVFSRFATSGAQAIKVVAIFGDSERLWPANAYVPLKLLQNARPDKTALSPNFRVARAPLGTSAPFSFTTVHSPVLSRSWGSAASPEARLIVSVPTAANGFD